MSAITDTIMALPGSVSSNPVVDPPTNTTWSRMGVSSRTTDSNNARFGSPTQQPAQSRRQLPLGDLTFSRPAFSEGIE
jgi:hypothetical protein